MYYAWLQLLSAVACHRFHKASLLAADRADIERTAFGTASKLAA
jgi:hypothetical protein